jgi:hypothetical protein
LFERALQAIDPSVALPYWRMDELPSVFEPNFMGSNKVSSDAFVVPEFGRDPADPTKPHPLVPWIVVNGQELKELTRYPLERRDADYLKKEFLSDDELLGDPAFSATYRDFRRRVEANPHNPGHTWTGPWMANCKISPSDPVFWPFHTGFDRQWAKWQWKNTRFEPDGSLDSYFPNDAFDAAAAHCNDANPSGCVPVGHHLKDTMWPWDSRVGPGTVPQANRPPADLSTGLVGPFPKSSVVGLWPSAPALPTPGDMIDYAGSKPGRLDMGFAYDDVPFGGKPRRSSMPLSSVALRIFADRTAPTAERAAAAVQVRDLGSEDVSALLGIASDQDQPEPVRVEAFRLLSSVPDGNIVGPALAVLKTSPSATLATAAVEALTMQMMFAQIDEHTHHGIMDGLRAALSSPHAAVRVASLRALAAPSDPVLLTGWLRCSNGPTAKAYPSRMRYADSLSPGRRKGTLQRSDRIWPTPGPASGSQPFLPCSPIRQAARPSQRFSPTPRSRMKSGWPRCARFGPRRLASRRASPPS